MFGFIRLLKTTPANDEGDVLEVQFETETDIYVTDGWDRHVYFSKFEEGTAWEWTERPSYMLPPDRYTGRDPSVHEIAMDWD